MLGISPNFTLYNRTAFGVSNKQKPNFAPCKNDAFLSNCSVSDKNFRLTKICTSNFLAPNNRISFCGMLVRPLQNKKEISELAKIFFEAYNNNLPSCNILAELLDKNTKKIACLPFWYKLNKPDCYVEAVFNNNRMAGGYSFKIDTEKSIGHIEFMTLADKYKHTKFGISALKEMTGRICQKADENNVKEISWVVNIANIPAKRLFARFGAEETGSMDIGGNMKYKIPFEEFKKEFAELAQRG